MKLHVSLPAAQIAAYRLLTHAYYHLAGDGSSEAQQLLLNLRSTIYLEMAQETSVLLSDGECLEAFVHSDSWKDGLSIYPEPARA